MSIIAAPESVMNQTYATDKENKEIITWALQYNCWMLADLTDELVSSYEAAVSYAIKFPLVTVLFVDFESFELLRQEIGNNLQYTQMSFDIDKNGYAILVHGKNGTTLPVYPVTQVVIKALKESVK